MIGLVGYEGNVLVVCLVWYIDLVFLYYCFGGFMVEWFCKVLGMDLVMDVVLFFVVSCDDFVSGGCYKVWGSKLLWVLL